MPLLSDDHVPEHVRYGVNAVLVGLAAAGLLLLQVEATGVVVGAAAIVLNLVGPGALTRDHVLANLPWLLFTPVQLLGVLTGAGYDSIAPFGFLGVLTLVLGSLARTVLLDHFSGDTFEQPARQPDD